MSSASFLHKLRTASADLFVLDHLFCVSRLHFLVGFAALILLFSSHSSGVPLVVPLVLCAAVVAILWQRSQLGLVAVERRMPTSSHQDESVRIVVQLRNLGRSAIPQCRLKDVFPGESIGQRTFFHLECLARGQSATFTYHARCTACFGTYAVEPCEILVADHFGFFEKKVQAGECLRFRLFPRLYRFGETSLIGATIAHPTCLPTGQNGEMNPVFTGVREYRPGDPVHAIHWPSTARTGRPVVKEFESYALPHVHLLCDLMMDEMTAFVRNSAWEVSFKLALSFAQELAERSLNATLVLGGDDIELRHLEAGIENVASLLEWACDWRRVSLVPLGEMIVRCLDMVKAGDLVILIASVQGSGSGALQRAAMLRERGARVFGFLIDFSEKDGVRDTSSSLPQLDFPVLVLTDPGRVEAQVQEFLHRDLLVEYGRGA